MKIVATNRKAYHDFFILDSFQAGIALIGSEVKSIRQGNVNLKDSFVFVTNKLEMILKNMYIKTYDKTTSFAENERRDRKLLMNKNEIKKLYSKVKEKGVTLIPLELYFNGQYVKVKLGLAKGKHTYDKKDTIKEKDNLRELNRALKNY